jgi:hypothetical protein
MKIAASLSLIGIQGASCRREARKENGRHRSLAAKILT